jgi:hypothetical protein
MFSEGCKTNVIILSDISQAFLRRTQEVGRNFARCY